MKNKQFIKKIASLATAGAISLSTLTSLALPVSAASQNNTGNIQIDLVDSSVYGADRTKGNMNSNMLVSVGDTVTGGSPISAVFKQYWNNSLTNRDFLYTPQGLSTFDRRVIKVYDVSICDGDDNVTGKVNPGANQYDPNYYTLEFLEAQAEAYNIVHVRSLVVTRGGTVFKAIGGGQGEVYDLGYNNRRRTEEIFNTENSDLNFDHPDNFDWLIDGHHYVMVEETRPGYSRYNYIPGKDDDTQAWQVSFQWTGGDIKLAYDENVSSESNIGIPLHNEVSRGNFSFNVVDKELQTYEGQGLAKIEGSIYAVYNISNTATDNQVGTAGTNKIAWKNDGTSTAGYVIADRNGDGTLSDSEKLTYIPAYSETDINIAYNAYLADCNTNNKVRGDYEGKLNDDEFILGNNSAGKPIIPVMLLRPDENGNVSTGTYGLPVGNYMVVQIQAGNGYYLDQNFRPIISMAPWVGKATDNNKPVVGYGNAYFDMLCDNYANTVTYARNNSALDWTVTKSPVAFCPTGTNTKLNTVTGGKYYFDAAGNLRYNIGDNLPDELDGLGPVYETDSEGVMGNNYVLNVNDERMKPTVNTNKFTVQNPVIRAGAYFNIADSDDVKNPVNDLNIDEDGNYIVIPQGNGLLDGAQFKVSPFDRDPYKITNKVKLYTTGVTLTSNDSHVYTVKDNKLTIPADDLPFGMYKIEQVNTGAGYEVCDWSVAVLLVTSEDSMLVRYNDQYDVNGEYTGDPSDTLDDYMINGEIYIPNEIINGGEVYSLTSSTAPAGEKVTLSVYNISNEYVYVDKDNNGTEERFETNKYTYINQIAGKGLSYENTLKVVNNWTPCKTIEIEVGKTKTYDDSLPYGTYLVVVTGVPAGYDITGEFMGTDTILSENDNVEFETKIDNLATLPVIETLFSDAETNIDSIAIKNRVFLKDLVKIENLVGGQDYTIYGAIIDKSTGNLLMQGAVAYANGTAYKATDLMGATPGTNSRAAEVLLNDGVRFLSWSDEYMAWVLEVRDYATSIGNQTLINYCDTAIADGSANKDNKFSDNRTRITATLKYLARGEAILTHDIDGTLELTVNFDALDTRDLEGKTLVAYEYVCDNIGAPVTDALIAQSTGGLLAALDTVLIASHRDLSDEAQTVYLPTLDIEAYASYTKAKTIDPSETIEALVTYGNVEPGNKYAIEAWLVDAYGAKVSFKNEEGNTVTSLRQDFTAFATQSDTVFTFEGLDMAAYNNQRLTVYATLYRRENNQLNTPTDFWLIEKGSAASMGYDITDPEPGKNQVDVVAPTVKTVLSDALGRKTVNFDRKVSLKDKVTYSGLVVGGVYNSKLTLVDINGVTLFDDEGKELVAEHKFTATKEEMTIEIPITFMGKDLRGMEIVAFNDLYRQTPDKIALVAQEHNVLAADQTIEATGDGFKVTISTVAMNPDNNTHVLSVAGGAAAIDNVTIRNLEPATQYILKTTLAYAANGKTITQFMPVETTFETDVNGTAKIEVPMTINTIVFKGKTLVVYQTVYDINGEDIIAMHENRNDTNQMLYVPDIDTVATANDGISKKIVPEKKEVNLTNDPNGQKETKYYTEVMDTIYYKNLVPGNMYKITTEVVTQDGKASLGMTTRDFTALTSAGTTTVFIDLDVTSYLGKNLVVYETITDAYSGAEVITHKDLADLDQTVEIVNGAKKPTDDLPEDPDNPNKPEDPNDPNKPEDPDDNTPGEGTDINTGVAENYGLFFIIGGAILLVACGLLGIVIYRRKKNN